MQTGLPASHLLLALLVVAVWGTNFVVVHQALDELPPLAFAALRFTFAVLPAALFLKKPAVPWANLAAYGLLVGVGQFGLLFIAMDGHISPGLASLVVQMQVFFTIALSVFLTGERLRFDQSAALLVALCGVILIGMNTDGSATWLGLGLVVAAAGCWGAANIVARATPRANMVAYMVWTSLFAAPVLWALALVVEGPNVIASRTATASAAAWMAVIWQAGGNALFGYAAWAWLLARHPAATITPVALLVPVFGMGSSALLLGEPLPPWKLFAALLILAGLAVGLLSAMRHGRRTATCSSRE